MKNKLDYFRGNKTNIILNKEFLKDFFFDESCATTHVMIGISLFLCSDGYLRNNNKFLSLSDLAKLLNYQYENLRKQIKILKNKDIIIEKKVEQDGKKINVIKINDNILSIVSSKEVYQYCIYRFVDKNNETLYVGKTNNISQRMLQHKNQGHLPKECYDNVDKILYYNTNSDSENSIYEICCINHYLPRYNIEYKDEGISGFIDVESLIWEYYNKI